MLYQSIIIRGLKFPGDSTSWDSPKEADIVRSYLINLSELNIKFFIKHTRSVAELTEIKKSPENLFISPRGT